MTATSRRHLKFAVCAVALVGVVALLAILVGDRSRGPEPAPRDTGAAPEPSQPSISSDANSSDVAPARSAADAPLWEAVDEASVHPLPEYAAEWSTEGRVLVRTGPALAAVGGWRLGDRLTLPVPQIGAVYHPLIEQIDEGPGGSRSALGKVRGDDGRERRYVVTAGPIHVFAYVDTPAGPYELVGGVRYGWLLPTASMTAGVDFSEPDYILPED